MATPKPKPKTPSQAAQRRAEPSSSQSTLTTARKRLNAGTPSKQSGPPSKKRKISKLEQLPEEEDASGDAAFQNAIAQEADREDLQPSDLLRRSHRARAAASTAPSRNTPPSQRSSPPSAQPRPASGRPQAVEEQDDEYEPGEDGQDEDAEQKDEDEEEKNNQNSTPRPRSANRPAKTPKSTATIPTGTPAPISSAAPKDMTAEELKRVAGSFTTGDIMAMQRVVTQFGELRGFEPFKVNEIIHSDPKSNNYANSIFTKLKDVCPGYSRRQVIDKARKLFHNFQARGEWSAEEDAQLRDYCQQHGNKWKYIGDLMDRHPMDIRDRHRTLAGRSRVVRKDKWQKKETEKLLDVTFRVREVIESLRQETTARFTRPLDDDVPWKLVADWVGGDRTAAQCRDKWEKENGRGGEPAPAPSSSKGKAVASSSRGVRSNKRSKLASRQPSVELGRSQTKYKSSERVEESDSEEDEDQEMADGDQEGHIEEEEDQDQEMGDEDQEGQIDEEEDEIPDSQPAHGEQETARPADSDDEVDGLSTVEQPLLLPPPAVEPDEEGHEHLTPGDLLVKPSEPEDEESPPQVNGSRSRSPGIKTEQPDGLPVVNGTVGEKSSSEENSEEDSSEAGLDEGSSDDGEDEVKNEPPTSSSEASSDSSSPESEEESSSDDGSIQEDASSDEDASSGEDSSSSEEVQKSKKRPARKTAPKSASQPTTSYTQDRFTKAPTSPLETRKSPLAKSSTQPATEGHRVNGVAQGRTPGKSSTQPVTNGNAASRSSSKNSTNSKKGSRSNSRSSSKASRAKSEPSSDSDVEDIPNTAPPLIPSSARRLTAAVTRRLNW